MSKKKQVDAEAVKTELNEVLLGQIDNNQKLVDFWFLIPNRIIFNYTPQQFIQEGNSFDELLRHVKEAIEDGRFE